VTRLSELLGELRITALRRVCRTNGVLVSHDHASNSLARSLELDKALAELISERSFIQRAFAPIVRWRFRHVSYGSVAKAR